MSLLYIDGFDTYGTSGQPSSRWSITNNGSGGVSSSYGRNGVGFRLFSGSTTNYADRAITGNPTALVVGFAFRVSSTLTHANANYGIVQLMEGGTVNLTLGMQSASGALQVFRGTAGGGTLLATASDNALALNTWYYIELKATINDSGSFTVRVNGANVGSLTAVSADTKNGGSGVINNLRLAQADGVSQNPVNEYDDLYVLSTSGGQRTDFLGDCRVEALLPTVEGTHSEWDPSTGLDNAAVVDEAAPNDDTDFISTSTTARRDTTLYGDLATVTGIVYGVQADLRARKDEAGSRSIAPMITRSGSDQVGSDHALANTYADYIQVFEQDPIAAADWTIALVNATEFGVKLTV